MKSLHCSGSAHCMYYERVSDEEFERKRKEYWSSNEYKSRPKKEYKESQPYVNVPVVPKNADLKKNKTRTENIKIKKINEVDCDSYLKECELFNGKSLVRTTVVFRLNEFRMKTVIYALQNEKRYVLSLMFFVPEKKYMENMSAFNQINSIVFEYNSKKYFIKTTAPVRVTTTRNISESAVKVTLRANVVKIMRTQITLIGNCFSCKTPIGMMGLYK